MPSLENNLFAERDSIYHPDWLLNKLGPLSSLKCVEVADPPPRLQLSQACAELVGPAFAASTNAWLLERFGRLPPPLKHGEYVMIGETVFGSRHSLMALASQLGV